MTIGFGLPHISPPYSSDMVWRLTKHARFVECHIRLFEHGIEVRALLDRNLVRSELVHGRDPLVIARAWKQQWLAMGWEDTPIIRPM